VGDIANIVESADELEAPVTIGVDAYISEDYVRLERDRLWRKTWLQAGRLEDLPQIRAFYNVCPHRGRKLVDTREGQRNARGRQMRFVCGFHAWTFNLDGACTYIQNRDDWQGQLTDEDTRLGQGRELGRVHLDQPRSAGRAFARLP